MDNWHPIESAPKGFKVLAGYLNEAGKWRTVIARYYPENSLTAAEDSEDEFAPEGWYEESETHEELLPILPPTHWMPLPAPPALAGDKA